MASNSSSCPTPGGGHLNGYPVPPYAFFFPPMLGGLSPPGALTSLQHQLPVSGYSTPSPASKWGGGRLGGGAPRGSRPQALASGRLFCCSGEVSSGQGGRRLGGLRMKRSGPAVVFDVGGCRGRSEPRLFRGTPRVLSWAVPLGALSPAPRTGPWGCRRVNAPPDI